ncbi:hypothetical protein GOB25_31775 [Sinorhizobium meliloti]|nr:hypothetical protein [Sinorhizobium meliloti]
MFPPTFVLDDKRPECLGAYFAATVVAGEIFKMSEGLLKGCFVDDNAYSLWTGPQGHWEELCDGPRVDGQTLPDCYLVGAGAVGQGVIQVLGACRLAEAYVVTIDHDHHDKRGTNLNRCFLAGVGDILKPKVDAVGRYRQFTGLGGCEFLGSLSDYFVGSKPGVP